MRTRWLATLMVFFAALAPALARAAEAPHDASFSDDDCGNCHRLYNPSSGGGTDYSEGCTQCHVDTSSRFGFPWALGDQAVPGYGGNHHSWSAYADKPSIGTSTPTNYAFAKNLVDGRLQCSVCHDTHFANGWAVGYVPKTSVTLGASSPTAAATVSIPASGTYATGGVGNGQLAIMAAANGTAPQGWRIKIQTFAGSSGTFIISKNFGLSVAQGMFWYTYQGGTWVRSTGTAADGSDAGTGKPFSVGNAAAQNVTLDDAGVTVRFISGTAPKVGDYWDVWVSYPFLRMPVAQLCIQCHKNQAMTHVRVSGQDPRYLPDGSRVFSHPVGEALNANGHNTDRTAANPDPNAQVMLDANGVAQTTGDANPTNDLVLDGGQVQCTTCHKVHNADSSSLTVDKR